MILRSLLSGFVAALLGSLSYGQPVAFFVNAETGGDGVGCGGAGSPCKSVTFMLGQIVLTPTQNAVVNLAGRIDAANNVIPYDEGNGETFPIVLPDKHSLVYDAVNSEFFPGGARVPAIVGMTQTPPTADVIQIVAVAPASIGPLTGLDGQTAGAGLRLLHVESGVNAVLVAASGATTNEAFLTGLTVRDGASTGVCIRAQDGAFTSNTVTDSTVTTNRNTSSLVKIAAANLAVPSTSTKTAVTMREVDVQVDQIGGIGVARPSVGVDIVASALVGGTPYVEFTAESVRVLGYSNGDPANPLGIDTGVYLGSCTLLSVISFPWTPKSS